MRITFETYDLANGLFLEFAVPFTEDAYYAVLSMRNSRNIRVS